MRLASLVVLALAAGCFSSGTREPQRYYVLELPASKTPTAGSARASMLVVAPTRAASFYETQDIVYSRSAGTRAYYQFNSWTERPSRAIHALLASRLEKSGAFREVVVPGSGVRGSLVLRTELDEMYHDAAQAPGSARIALSAELFDPDRGAIVARRSFRRSAPAPTYDAQGAVKAFGEALGGLLDEVAAWVDDAAAKHETGGITDRCFRASGAC